MMTIIDLMEQGVELQGHVRVREWAPTVDGDDGYVTYFDGLWEELRPADEGGFGTEWMRTGITYMHASWEIDHACLVIEVGRW